MVTFKINPGACLTLMAGLTLIGGNALAQSPNLDLRSDSMRGQTISERPRPNYDPLGIRMGSFVLYPELGVSETYDDNIFATQTGESDDFVTKLLPAVALESDWNNHFLGFAANSEIAWHARNSGENYEDYSASLRGRVDVQRDTYVQGDIAYAKRHEQRGEPDDVNGVEPTEFTEINPALTLYNKWNRLSLTADLRGSIKDFDDVALSSGAVANNDDRDRQKYELVTRFGYEIVPQYEGFVSAGYNSIDYDDGVDDNGFNRDSDGYEVVVGTRLDLSGVLSGDIFAGYRSQDYEDAQLETISGPTVGAELTWNMSKLTTIKGSVSRTVMETTQTGASGYFNTGAGLSVDHELLRNLLIGGNLSAANQKYRGNGRDDNVYELGIYAKYLLNRRLYISADYDFTRRNSNAAASSYSKNAFMVKLTTQF